MKIARIRFANVVLALVVAAIGLLTLWAPAVAHAAEKKESGPSHLGVVKAVDAGKRTLTMNVTIKPGSKETEDKTFTIAQDAKVLLEDRLTKTQPLAEGTLADLTEGTSVTVQLDADKKGIVTISARGPGLTGRVKAVNPSFGTITVGYKGKDGPAEQTFTLVTGAKVLLNDGLKKDGEDKECQLVDLVVGTPVSVQLTVNRTSALGIRVLGDGVHGSLTAYNAANGTIALSVKEDGMVVEKTFTIVPDARIDNLTVGQPVHVQLSVFDKTKVVAAHHR